MGNIADKNCREDQNTGFMVKTFFSENRHVYEVMWKNNLDPDRPELTSTTAHAIYKQGK
jgi:hypothetical protein